jgi:hypothetical protein
VCPLSYEEIGLKYTQFLVFGVQSFLLLSTRGANPKNTNLVENLKEIN